MSNKCVNIFFNKCDHDKCFDYVMLYLYLFIPLMPNLFLSVSSPFSIYFRFIALSTFIHLYVLNFDLTKLSTCLYWSTVAGATNLSKYVYDNFWAAWKLKTVLITVIRHQRLPFILKRTGSLCYWYWLVRSAHPKIYKDKLAKLAKKTKEFYREKYPWDECILLSWGSTQDILFFFAHAEQWIQKTVSMRQILTIIFRKTQKKYAPNT